MNYRNNIDAWIFDQVVNKDEYKIRNINLNNKVIIDIGSQAGFFSWICLKQGASKVYAFEIADDNIEFSKMLMFSYADKFEVRKLAVWRSDIEPELRMFGEFPIWPGTNIKNYGGVGLALENVGVNEVWTTGLDSVIQDILSKRENIAVLKIDAESSEWPIILTSELIGNIPYVVGEFHEVGGDFDTHNPEVIGLPYPKYDISLLEEFFTSLDYSFSYNRWPNMNLGNFWAKKVK